MMEPTPVYICTGFLDSGKTLLVKDTLMEQEWIEPGLTLLILCEEGEEEYSKEYLEENDMVLLKIDKFEQLNAAFFTNCEKNYHPAQVVIEYNGMWKLEDLLQLKYPRKWQIQGIYSTVNGTTLDMYLKNMRNMLMEQLTESELIIINRCPEGVDRSGFRRALKVQNPMAQLIFEGMDGKIIQPTAEDLPFDIKENPIKVEDEDFGIWYVDAYDHPDQYMDKEIEFVAQAFRPKGMKNDMFVPVRKIMTCCADDVQFMGFLCKADDWSQIKSGQYVTVTARMEYKFMAEYGEEGPVFYAEEIVLAEKPEDELVYFN